MKLVWRGLRGKACFRRPQDCARNRQESARGKHAPPPGGPSPAPPPRTHRSTVAPGLGTPLCFRTWRPCCWRQVPASATEELPLVFFGSPGPLGAWSVVTSPGADAAPSAPVPRLRVGHRPQPCSPWVSALGDESGRSSACVLRADGALEDRTAPTPHANRMSASSLLRVEQRASWIQQLQETLEPKTAFVASVSLQVTRPTSVDLDVPPEVSSVCSSRDLLGRGWRRGCWWEAGYCGSLPCCDSEPTACALAGQQGQYGISVAHKVSLGRRGTLPCLTDPETHILLPCSSITGSQDAPYIANMSEFHRQFCSLSSGT
ncbi:serine/arginine repetitive matrix protein 1-like [Suricata suricatta]|uniref:serine/arginine repetitive matrix protein 1-like n=1 Tax=Suricata suricatta TaxID=37032 RepID=UPI0011557CB7|nr:serine/arginine repetitive matrix protein 1-like [Suricata suricatta]